MKTLTKHISLLIILGGAVFAAQPTGSEIIEKVYERPTSTTMEANLSMILENSRGDQRVREIKQFIKDFGDVEKKLMVFLKPSDVKNTSFMNWSFDDGSEDQWIYLPALKKIKRISSDSKSDYSMGSDFTYDDLGDRHPTDDTHKLLREETVNGESCYVVESIPKDDEYMYSRTVSWIIKDKWIGLKKEFYDEDEELLKTLTVKKYEKIKNFWIILHSEMHNVQKDHTTKMELANMIIDGGIPDNKFTERMMRRGLK